MSETLTKLKKALQGKPFRGRHAEIKQALAEYEQSIEVQQGDCLCCTHREVCRHYHDLRNSDIEPGCFLGITKFSVIFEALGSMCDNFSGD